MTPKISPIKMVPLDSCAELDIKFDRIIYNLKYGHLKVIDMDALIDYYHENNITIDLALLRDAQFELQEAINGGLLRAVKKKNLKGIRIEVHRILGIAQYMFMKRVIATSVAFIDVIDLLSNSVGYDDAMIESHVASMNVLLQRVVKETLYCLSAYEMEVLESKNKLTA